MRLRAGDPEEAGICGKRLQRIAQLVEGWVNDGFTPSFAYVIARKGIVVASRAFGRRTVGTDGPDLTTDTIFPVSSISKVITVAAAMVLADEGRLSTVLPVSYYLPEFQGEGKNIVCVHHLMTHTSGLRDQDIYSHVEQKRKHAHIPPPADNQHPAIHEHLVLGYDAPLWKPPGTEMSYCGFGLELLGEIVRRVSGQSLNAFTRERLFEPLGMKDTWFVVPDSVNGRLIEYPKDAAFPGLSKPGRLTSPWAAGGLYSTAEDMAIFGQMFLNKGTYGDQRILSKAAVETMTRNQIPGISSQWNGITFDEAGWGFGWNISGTKRDETGTLRSPQAYSHSGAGCTFVLVDPVYEVVETCFMVTMKFNHNLDRRFDRFTDAVIASVTD